MMNSTYPFSEPMYGAFVGTLGITAAQVFASLGAAYGIAKSAVGITHTGVMKPDMVMKSIIPGWF
jgi:V-type H+-transporting ATPase proteolipid subunit